MKLQNPKAIRDNGSTVNGSTVTVVARTTDDKVFVIRVNGCERLERKQRIDAEAFPMHEVLRYGYRNGTRTERDYDGVSLPLSENMAFNSALYPEHDCYLIDGDTERALDTLAQIKGCVRKGYKETAKQRTARLHREAEEARELLAALGFEQCADCPDGVYAGRGKGYWQSTASYHNPADLIEVPERYQWKLRETAKVCRTHFAARLGELVTGLRAMHDWSACGDYRCNAHVPTEALELLPDKYGSGRRAICPECAPRWQDELDAKRAA